MADATDAHARAIRIKGAPGIRDLALLESAINRPYVGYYHRIWHKAAALAESIVGNHPFVDGNKRTAVMLVDLLIERSGFHFDATDSDQFERNFEAVILGIATGRLRYADLVPWFRDRIVPVTR